MPAWLPTTFEAAIKAVITYSISTVDDEAAALPFIITARRIETYPTTWSMFALAWQVL